MPTLCLTKSQADQKIKVHGQFTTVGAIIAEVAQTGVGGGNFAIQENEDGSFTVGILADFGGGGFLTFGFL